MLPTRRNVLVLHSGALGDFVLAWPLVLALGRTQPQSRIIVVTAAGKGKLAEAALRVESSDIESGWQGLFVKGGEPRGLAEKLIAGAREIYSFISREGDVATDNLRRWGGGVDVVCIASRPAEGATQHAAEFLAEQLKDRPVTGVGVRQMLASIGDRGLGFGPNDGGGGGGDVLVHPGSGSARKNWPREKFFQLISNFRKAGWQVRVILGEVEEEKWPQAEVAQFAALAQVKRPADYVGLFEELKSAGLVIANDSGPGHLAGIMGLRTISLFGPTDPAIWRPLGPRVTVLGQELSADDVYDAAVKQKG